MHKDRRNGECEIRKGDELTVDYGIQYDQSCEEDRSLDWYRDYECSICGERTKIKQDVCFDLTLKSV